MKTILVTFAGRKKFLQILFKYIEKYKHYFDEYHIYVSTDNVEDIDFIKKFEEKNISYVKTFYREYPDHDLWNQAWKNCQKDDEVYIKLDDDIVYLDESLFTNFLKFRKEKTEYPFIYPMIINNYYCSWVLQEYFNFKHILYSDFGIKWKTYSKKIANYINGRRDSLIEIRYFDKNKITPFRVSKIIPEKITDLLSEDIVFCNVGWGNLEFCKNLHEKFILDIKNKNINKYIKSNIVGLNLSDYPPVSINCVSWLGKQLKEITNKYGDVWQDEPWVSIYTPIMTNSPNFIYFGSIVSHFSYYKQSQLGIDNTNLLNEYLNICNEICD